MTDTPQSTLVEAIAKAIWDRPTLETSLTGVSNYYANLTIEALCTYSGLTVEIIERIRNEEAVVVPTKSLRHVAYYSEEFKEDALIFDRFWPHEIQLNTPIERPKT